MGLFSIFGEDDKQFVGGDLDAAEAASNQNIAKTGGGYQLGSLSTGENRGVMQRPTGNRQDQTVSERTAEQRANFLYGGSVTGMQDAEGELRANMQPWATGFGAMGQGFYDAGQGAAGRQAPVYREGLASYWDDRGAALNAAGDLYNRAQQGPGPSAAQAQLNASTAQGLRQQLMLAGSGRGAGGGASAFRQAAANQAQMQGAASAQAANLRAQEEAAWRQQQAAMLGQASALYQQQQAQDLAASGYYTGAQQQQTQMNDAAGLGYGQLGLGAMQAGAQTQLGTEGQAHSINMGGLSASSGYEDLLARIDAANKGISMQNKQLGMQEEAARLAAMGTIYTAAANTSDIRAKKDVEPAEDEVTGMLRRLGVEQEGPAGPTMAERYSKATGVGTPVNPYGKPDLSGVDFRVNDIRDPYAEPARRQVPTARFPDATEATDAARETSASSFRYKNPERHGEGRFVGPMAQELERTPAGKSLVSTQPDGTKAVDGGRAGLLALSAAGTQQRQQDDFAARMAEADAKIARLEAMLGEEDERKRKRSGFDVDLSSPNTVGMDEVSRRERSYTP